MTKKAIDKLYDYEYNFEALQEDISFNNAAFPKPQFNFTDFGTV